jgi:hypothetical protein
MTTQQLSALDAKVADYVNGHVGEVDEAGYRLVVRNGKAPERTLVTGACACGDHHLAGHVRPAGPDPPDVGQVHSVGRARSAYYWPAGTSHEWGMIAKRITVNSGQGPRAASDTASLPCVWLGSLERDAP